MFDRFDVSRPLGLAMADLALLAGGLLLIVGVLILGFSGNKRGRRWLARLGWLTLMVSVAALGLGIVRSSGSSSAQQQS